MPRLPQPEAANQAIQSGQVHAERPGSCRAMLAMPLERLRNHAG